MMDPVAWGQIAFYAMVGAALVIFAISHLFRTMSSSYGSIIAVQQATIAGLQTQNADQERRMTEMRQRISKLTANQIETAKAVVEVEKKVANGH